MLCNKEQQMKIKSIKKIKQLLLLLNEQEDEALQYDQEEILTYITQQIIYLTQLLQTLQQKNKRRNK